ncbi:MAG: hypothetical protein PHP20_10290 [Firmicutes bacterium]|nr:hypothetical protein [Bacillota bacterium]MDD4793440.1 hypothetical protein [Bacillota bacterium]
MKAIRQRSYVFATVAGIGVAVSLLILACTRTVHQRQARMLLTVSLPASACMAALWAQEHRRLKIAQLIVENQILHIRTATICDTAGDAAEPEQAKTIDVVVSYFGILLDSRVIKFNQDGIFLKAVEIGPDSITLTYGTDRRVQSARLLHALIDDEQVKRIVEQFRHETGIVPVIIN